MADYSRAKSRLRKHLSELKARAAGIESELAQPMSADSEEQAVEAEDDEILEYQDDALHREMKAVRLAITRINLGVYGRCTWCGGQIGLARLAVMPTTTQCIDCARASAG
jgi:RNA polymerase-binding transcription factor DksA